MIDAENLSRQMREPEKCLLTLPWAQKNVLFRSNNGRSHTLEQFYRRQTDIYYLNGDLVVMNAANGMRNTQVRSLVASILIL